MTRIKSAALCAVLLGCALSVAAAGKDAGEPELLEPEIAFRLAARLVDARTAEIHFDIADGYYMYRDKFRFKSDPATVTLGKAVFPKGQVKRDPFFGKVETYRKQVTLRVPVVGLTANAKLPVTIFSQGCADVGVCYPPMTSHRVLELQPARTDQPLSSILRK